MCDLKNHFWKDSKVSDAAMRLLRIKTNGIQRRIINGLHRLIQKAAIDGSDGVDVISG